MTFAQRVLGENGKRALSEAGVKFFKSIRLLISVAQEAEIDTEFYEKGKEGREKKQRATPALPFLWDHAVQVRFYTAERSEFLSHAANT